MLRQIEYIQTQFGIVFFRFKIGYLTPNFVSLKSKLWTHQVELEAWACLCPSQQSIHSNLNRWPFDQFIGARRLKSFKIPLKCKFYTVDLFRFSPSKYVKIGRFFWISTQRRKIEDSVFQLCYSNSSPFPNRSHLAFCIERRRKSHVIVRLGSEFGLKRFDLFKCTASARSKVSHCVSSFKIGWQKQQQHQQILLRVQEAQ